MKFGDARLPERFWTKCIPEPNSGCWLWFGCLVRGYGQIHAVSGKRVKAHRLSYEVLAGPIPDGLVLDHRVCQTPCCVNPAHLEPVTPHENMLRGKAPTAHNARKTHCAKGHPYDEANTYVSKKGRECRECHRVWGRERPERVAARAKRAALKGATP